MSGDVGAEVAAVFHAAEQRAAQVRDAEGNLTGYVLDVDHWRELRAIVRQYHRQRVEAAKAEAWDEGWRAAQEVVELEGVKCWAHTVFPEGYEGNPYKEAGA